MIGRTIPVCFRAAVTVAALVLLLGIPTRVLADPPESRVERDERAERQARQAADQQQRREARRARFGWRDTAEPADARIASPDIRQHRLQQGPLQAR